MGQSTAKAVPIGMNNDILVYEGIVSRPNQIAVLERFVFNKSTNEFAIKILAGPQADAMRTLHTRSGLANFLKIVSDAGLTIK